MLFERRWFIYSLSIASYFFLFEFHFRVRHLTTAVVSRRIHHCIVWFFFVSFLLSVPFIDILETPSVSNCCFLTEDILLNVRLFRCKFQNEEKKTIHINFYDSNDDACTLRPFVLDALFFPNFFVNVIMLCSFYLGNKSECFDMNIIMFDLEFS